MASKSELEGRIDMIDSILSILQEVRASEMTELEKIENRKFSGHEQSGCDRKATISLSFRDGQLNEHSEIMLSTDRAGWQNLLEFVLSEACKAKKEV